MNRHLLDWRLNATLINSLLAGLLIIFSPWSAAEPTAKASPATSVIKFYVEDIKSTMGWSFVPETFQLIAHDPAHLDSYWANYKLTMTPGRLDLETKKLIAYLISVMNNCGV